MNNFQTTMMKRAGLLTESQIRRLKEIGEPVDPKQVKAEKEIEKVKAISHKLFDKHPDILSYDLDKEAGVFHMLHRPKDTGPHPSKNEGIRDDWDKEIAAQRAKESAEWKAFQQTLKSLPEDEKRKRLIQWIKSGRSSGATHDDIIQRQKPPTGRPKTNPDWDKPSEPIDEDEGGTYHIRAHGNEGEPSFDIKGIPPEETEDEYEDAPLEIPGAIILPKHKTSGTSSTGDDDSGQITGTTNEVVYDLIQKPLKGKTIAWKSGSGLGMAKNAKRPTMTMTREKDTQKEPQIATTTNELLNVDVDKQKDSQDMFSKGKPEPKDDKDDSPVYHATWKDFGNMHTYNLRKDYPEHGLVKGSTVARTKLQKLGIAHPEPPVEVSEGEREYYPKRHPIKLKKPTYSPKRHPIKQVGGKFSPEEEPLNVHYHDTPDENPLGVIDLDTLSEVLVEEYVDDSTLDKEKLKQLLIGAVHELEHTEDINIALQIAMDHIQETPDYYTKLSSCGL